MKVIFVNRFFHPDHSATSQLLSDLAFDLAAGGQAVTVITSRQRIDRPDAALPAAERIGGVDVRRVWTTCSSRASMIGRALDYATFYLAAGIAVLTTSRRGDVVVAKTDPPLVSVVGALAATARRARQVNWLHDLFPEVAVRLGVGALSGITGRLLRRLRNWSLTRAEVNVVLGEGMAAALAAEGIAPEKLRIVPNWCDGTAIRPLPPENNALRKAWGLEKTFVAMYSGNLGRAHEFDTLLAAVRMLKHRADIAFVIVGDGVRRPGLEAEAAREDLKNIHFKDYQPRALLGESLSAGDVHLISLRPELEGLIVPSKFYGIAAAGRPSLFIGSPDGEIARILEQAGCGLSVAAGDGEALAQGIESLAADAARRQAMGRAAREVFEQRFDKPLALKAWREVLGVKAASGEVNPDNMERSSE